MGELLQPSYKIKQTIIRDFMGHSRMGFSRLHYPTAQQSTTPTPAAWLLLERLCTV